MTTKTCQTCKHWRDIEPTPYSWVAKREYNHRACEIAVHDDGDVPTPNIHPVLVLDHDNYLAELYTLPDHGCNSWDAKE